MYILLVFNIRILYKHNYLGNQGKINFMLLRIYQDILIFSEKSYQQQQYHCDIWVAKINTWINMHL